MPLLVSPARNNGRAARWISPLHGLRAWVHDVVPAHRRATGRCTGAAGRARRVDEVARGAEDRAASARPNVATNPAERPQDPVVLRHTSKPVSPESSAGPR